MRIHDPPRNWDRGRSSENGSGALLKTNPGVQQKSSKCEHREEVVQHVGVPRKTLGSDFNGDPTRHEESTWAESFTGTQPGLKKSKVVFQCAMLQDANDQGVQWAVRMML